MEEEKEPTILDMLDAYDIEKDIDDTPVEEEEEEVEQEEIEEEETPEPVKEPAKEFNPEAVAKAAVEAHIAIEERKKAELSEQPAELSEEEFAKKFKPVPVTEEEIAKIFDLSSEMDEAKIRRLTDFHNQKNEDTYQKVLAASDVLLQDTKRKLEAEYKPTVQQVSQFHQQQLVSSIGNRVKEKYPVLADEGIRDKVANYVFPAVFEQFKRENPAPTKENLERFVDTIATKSEEFFKGIKPDFDLKKSETISQTKKPAKKRAAQPASLSTGAQSGGDTPKGKPKTDGSKSAILSAIEAYK